MFIKPRTANRYVDGTNDEALVVMKQCSFRATYLEGKDRDFIAGLELKNILHDPLL